MAERIIPGTYITVRAEGLISAGRIASGIVGVVGTASSGPIGIPTTLSGFANALEIFGAPDNFDRPENGSDPLTLTRTLEHIYNNGASTVIAVRLAAATAAAASYDVRSADDKSVVVLSAASPGSWGNNIRVEIIPAENDCAINDEVYTTSFTSLQRGNIVQSSSNQIRVFRDTSKRMETLNVIYTGAVRAGQVKINTSNGTLTFASNEAPSGKDRLIASYLVSKANCVMVELTHGGVTEGYTVPDGNVLASLVNRSSTLATAEASVTDGSKLPATGVGYFGTGSNTAGSNGAEAGANDYAAGLDKLSGVLVNIVVMAGQDAQTMGAVLAGHLKSTEASDFERIGVIGAAGNMVADFLGHDVSDERIVLAAPGLAYSDGRKLPAAYTAAAVAGLIASLDVQTSLTNKALVVPGLAVDANRGQQEQLIRKNLLTIIRKDGYRVLKGITTSGEGTPFSSIPTRRIVDYAKYGVRSASNPYIGRLNNSRVRSALKATLDAFLTRMVEDEALTGYELEVSATRAQEIAGEVSVVMTLQPTFSIDYIRVTMNLK